MFRSDTILPPDPEGLEVLHDREYRVRASSMASSDGIVAGRDTAVL